MKSGFLSIMLGVITSLFYSKSSYSRSKSPFHPPAVLPFGEAKARSYGKRRVYPPSTKRDFVKREKHKAMVQELNEAGVTWDNNKLYWKTHQLAIQNS